MVRKRITIYWHTDDRELRKRICKHFGCKYAVSVNGFSDMDILEKDLEYFKSGETKGLYDIRNFENAKLISIGITKGG